MNVDGRPRALRHPEYFDPGSEPFENNRDAYAPLVWQCRYSGIETPDSLWTYVEFGNGRPYSDNQSEHMIQEESVIGALDAWARRLVEQVARKGKVPPGRYPAAGYTQPSHALADLRLKWREMRMSASLPRSGSSPAAQQALGLNDDVRWSPSRAKARSDVRSRSRR